MTESFSVHIRWMIRRDMPEVLDIEYAGDAIPWSEEEFAAALRQRNCIAMVAEHGANVVGFMMYELTKGQLHLLKLAVHPALRRRGIGAALLRKLRRKLRGDRPKITLHIRETNLPGQLFLRAGGFKATKVARKMFPDALSPTLAYEDGYAMEYVLPPLSETADDAVPAEVGCT